MISAPAFGRNIILAGKEVRWRGTEGQSQSRRKKGIFIAENGVIYSAAARKEQAINI